MKIGSKKKNKERKVDKLKVKENRKQIKKKG